MKPVYMITGFLESGKTEFISYTLGQDYFRIKGKTLLILCEEGELEYDPELLEDSNTVVELIEDEEDFNADNLSALDKKHRPERIIVEFNGMWNYKNVKLPWFWSVDQQITTIDCSTFPMYYTNMKSLLTEMLRKSDMVIVNRCDGTSEKDLASYRRNIKAVNQKADIVFEDSQGEVNQMFEEDLPYDLSKNEIKLDNMGYGIFYIDSFDHTDRYVGKTLTFLAEVLKPNGIPSGYFVAGRKVMNCCAEDIAFMGYLCKTDDTDKVSQGDWITLTAKVSAEARPEYDGQVGIIFNAEKIEKAKMPAPKDQVISFV